MMKKLILNVIIAIFCLVFFNASFAKLVENKDYTILEQPVVIASDDKNQINIVEFFSYGCPYCYLLEPQINAWLAQKPTNVTFTRIAIPRKDRWIEYARLFYALDMISHQEQQRITPLIYQAIHEQKIKFNNDNEIINWAVEQQVDRTVLTKFYYSQDVTDKLQQAVELAQAYQLQYVPSIYVNGKYQLIMNGSNQYQDVKDNLNQLIEMIGN